MTNNEFKAWFEGFSENIQGRPTAKQWKRIQARVAEIDGRLVTPQWWQTVYHYYPGWYHYTPPVGGWTTCGGVVSPTVSNLPANSGVSTDTVMLANYAEVLTNLGRLESSVG